MDEKQDEKVQLPILNVNTKVFTIVHIVIGLFLLMSGVFIYVVGIAGVILAEAIGTFFKPIASLSLVQIGVVVGLIYLMKKPWHAIKRAIFRVVGKIRKI